MPDCILTSLFAGLFLDGLVLVDPPGDALLVRVLQAEVLRLQDVQVGEHVGQQLVAQGGSLKHRICQIVIRNKATARLKIGL